MIEVLNTQTLPQGHRLRTAGLTIGIYGSQILLNKPLALIMQGHRISFGIVGKQLMMWADAAGFEIKYNKTSYQYSIVHASLAQRIRTAIGHTHFKASQFEPLKFKLNPVQ
jgi:hypothetical protein